jgi:hypothetical protein
MQVKFVWHFVGGCRSRTATSTSNVVPVRIFCVIDEVTKIMVIMKGSLPCACARSKHFVERKEGRRSHIYHLLRYLFGSTELSTL